MFSSKVRGNYGSVYEKIYKSQQDKIPLMLNYMALV